MIPPSGFTAEQYPLRHRLYHSLGLSASTPLENSALMVLVRHTSDVIAGTPQSIVVNPHNALYVEDAGAAVCKMSIIDKLTMSLRFNLTEHFDGDSMKKLSFFWRPIFFSFQEKLLAADDDTGTTVETILALTSDTTYEDVVPLTTTKLPDAGASNENIPVSTVNIAEVFGDYNMTTDITTEEHVFDEDLFQAALRRYSIKGALRSMVGRTRHVTLSANKSYMNFYIDKFVPSAIRRIMPYSFFAIQVVVPTIGTPGQEYNATAVTANVAHLGVKLLCNYHEWNADHWQGMTGAAPAP